MSAVNKRSIIGITIALLMASLLAIAGSLSAPTVLGVPLFIACAVIAFAIQWLAFIPAYLLQSERFYDLTGSLTYLAVVGFALVISGSYDPRSLLLAACIGCWAVRLGSFLFVRVMQDGSDSRFDEIKPLFLRFLLTWTLQGLWVFVTAGSALAAISAANSVALGWLAGIGFALWLLGFAIEAVADWQKRVFRKRTGKQDYIRSGLWAYSRHPNYFGEILLWIGISVIAFDALSGWQYATLVSPLFVTLLLTKISGVPLLEAKSDKLWGDNPRYQAYKQATPVLVPRLSKPEI